MVATMNKLVKIGNKHYVETCWLHHADPKVVFVRWEVLEHSGWIPDPIPDYEVRHAATEGDKASYSMYLGNSQYITLVTPHHGQTEERPVPKPRVKATTETRWSHYGWQKYDKRKGWIIA